MESTNNSSSPLGRLFPVLLILAGLVGLYYLYQYLFGPKGTNSYTLISNSRGAHTNATHPIIITSDKLPNIYEGGEFTISTWIYITNWSYRTGFNKSIISVGGPHFDTIRMYLGGSKPKLSVRLQTRDTSGTMNTVPTGASSGVDITIGSSNTSQVPTESLDKATLNATFNILQTDSGLLDSSPLCDLPELDLQRWINITVSVNGRTVDVYMDGKLARSCVLPSFYKVDAGGYSANLLAYGGFGGQIATTTMYDSALNPEQVYKNYMAGPMPITSIGQWFSSFFAPGVNISVTTQ
jgi:hypothetical protein